MEELRKKSQKTASIEINVNVDADAETPEEASASSRGEEQVDEDEDEDEGSDKKTEDDPCIACGKVHPSGDDLPEVEFKIEMGVKPVKPLQEFKKKLVEFLEKEQPTPAVAFYALTEMAAQAAASMNVSFASSVQMVNIAFTEFYQRSVKAREELGGLLGLLQRLASRGKPDQKK